MGIELRIGKLAALVVRVLHAEFHGLDVIFMTILKDALSPYRNRACPIDFCLCLVRSPYVSIDHGLQVSSSLGPSRNKHPEPGEVSTGGDHGQAINKV